MDRRSLTTDHGPRYRGTGMTVGYALVRSDAYVQENWKVPGADAKNRGLWTADRGPRYRGTGMTVGYALVRSDAYVQEGYATFYRAAQTGTNVVKFNDLHQLGGSGHWRK